MPEDGLRHHGLLLREGHAKVEAPKGKSETSKGKDDTPKGKGETPKGKNEAPKGEGADGKQGPPPPAEHPRADGALAAPVEASALAAALEGPPRCR